MLKGCQGRHSPSAQAQKNGATCEVWWRLASVALPNGEQVTKRQCLFSSAVNDIGLYPQTHSLQNH